MNSTRQNLFCFVLFISLSRQLYCCESAINTDITMLKNNKLSNAIFDEANKPTEALLHLLKIMNVEHDGTLQTILVETQKWLRPGGQERWQSQNFFNHTYDDLSDAFKDLYLTQTIESINKNYTYAMLLGGDVSDIRNRLSYLIALWQDGVRFKSIVVPAGKRPLDQSIEPTEILLDNNCATLQFRKDWQFNGQYPTTETEMIKFVFDQTEIPEAWRSMPIVFVDTPMQKAEGDTLRRPNTHDTIKEWRVTENPKPGSILSISNQPFIGYQHAVVRASLPKGFVVDTVGCKIDSNNGTITTILDALARWIYNEYQLRTGHIL